MKLKQLEIKLQSVKGFAKPSAEREQYMTPAPLAARFLYTAALAGDLDGLSVADFGCGTGMLSVGAALLGGNVTGIDSDAGALRIAKENAGELPIAFFCREIEGFSMPADTVIMNPPFGAQNEHADRPFIDAALQSAPVVWGIFNKGSIPFIQTYIKGRAEITDKIAADFTIPRQFAFHTKDALDVPVEILRMERM
ncbi:MAG TPA: METTL5 family protein [Methanocorpusculum sp.]|nr:METTL5 family protein [Methanocorpusculum sp.]